MKKNRHEIEKADQEKVIEISVNNNKGTILLILILLAVVAFLVAVAVPLHNKATEIGATIGTTAGTAAGIAAGSFDGLTKGISDGSAAGEQQGESAEDTNVEISTAIASVGKLDVLLTEDLLVDNFREGQDFEASFLYGATETFSVDLGKAEVEVNDNTLTIKLPEPECEFVIDENSSEVLYEWQKHFWSGNTESGYNAYLNSRAVIMEKGVEEMTHYKTLLNQAKEAASEQVTVLASAISGKNYKIKVEFEGEDNKNEEEK
jgi:hypothetical protein